MLISAIGRAKRITSASQEARAHVGVGQKLLAGAGMGIAALDKHDPTSLELYCDANPDADECRVYDD